MDFQLKFKISTFCMC